MRDSKLKQTCTPQLIGSGYNGSCSEPITYLIYSNLNFLSNLAAFHKYNKTLHSCDTVSLSADLRYIYVVFFTYFYWFWTRRTSVEASPTTTITPASAVTHL